MPFWKKFKLGGFSFALLWFSLLPLVAAADDLDSMLQARVTKPEPPKTVARTYNGQVPLPEIAQGISTFFNSLITDDPAKAFQNFLQGTRLASRDQSIQALLDNTQHAFVLYGKITTFEPIDTYQVGTRLIVTTYLSFHPVTPLRWRFVYYKPDKTWQLFDLRVDDQISDIIEQ